MKSAPYGSTSARSRRWRRRLRRSTSSNYHWTACFHSTHVVYSDFRAAMLFRDSVLVDRIFRVFDMDDDGVISFPEYIACLSILSHKATQEEKLKCKHISYLCSRLHLTFYIHSLLPVVWLRLRRAHQRLGPNCCRRRYTQVITTFTLEKVLFDEVLCRENGVVITRTAIDELVAATMSQCPVATPNKINYDE